ncbi:MAG: IS66 family transposase [Planctomycetota bacterium]|jgi:transposase
MSDPKGEQDELQRLRAENARLRRELSEALERVRSLEEIIAGLETRLEEAQRQAARQAAPFRRDKSKKVPTDQKKRPGRKPGHRGAYRQVPEHIDDEVEVPLPCCPGCGGPVEDRAPLVQYIEEIPPVRPRVTRLVTWQAECPHCGPVQSTHPLKTSIAQGAAQVGLGPRALALSALLNKHLGLTMRKTCRVLAQGLGLSVTPGGLSQAMDRVAGKVESSYDHLLETLRTADVVFADETSWYVGRPGWWLWVFTNQQATAYTVDESRGSQVVRQVLGDDFAGMLVTDCLSTYDPIDCRKHKCIAHHQRAIAKARDRPDTKNPGYLDRWKQFFKTVVCLHGLRQFLPPEDFAGKREHLEQTCRQLLDEPVIQPGDVAVQKRLLKQQPHLLGCLYEPAAEPTNNRSERQLRPAVIARKVSCGNKTPRGKRTWEILTSLAATCQQNGIDFLESLAPKLPLAPVAG